MHVHELQSVLGVVVVRLNAVEQQYVTGLGDIELTAVLHAEASLADVGDEQRRITVALHKIVGGAVVVTAPCRVEQQLSRVCDGVNGKQTDSLRMPGSTLCIDSSPSLFCIHRIHERNSRIDELVFCVFSQKAGLMNFAAETLIEYIHKIFYT